MFPLQFPPRVHQSLHRPAGKGWMEMLTHQTTYKRARCEASNLTCAFTPGANGLLRIADGDFYFNRLLTWQQRNLVVSLAFPPPERIPLVHVCAALCDVRAQCNPVTARALLCQPTLPIITYEEEMAPAPAGTANTHHKQTDTKNNIKTRKGTCT